jgi:titin
VIIQAGAAGNQVQAANVISANAFSGVLISGSGTTGNLVAGNDIGTDWTGENRLGNTLDGVVVTFGASSNTIGGTTAATRNVISANGNDGILISGSGTSYNQVQGNYIGTDASGMNALRNVLNGVSINSGASNNTVGGSLDASNLIEFNGYNGVEVEDTGTTGNMITYDTIDNNTFNGVFLSGVSGNTVASCTLNDNLGWGILDTTVQNSLSNNIFNKNEKGSVGN